MPDQKIQERLSPVSERYVSQQQTFRQGPGLQPEAQIQSGVAAPVDSTRNTLLDLAQGLSKLTDTLGSFFQTESQFGQINQKVNELRGEAGAPQATGMGILKWGVKEGYQRGQGVKLGATLSSEFLNTGARNNWFVDSANPDENATKGKITELYKGLEKKYLGTSNNPEVINGALQSIAKARLTADVESTKILGDAFFDANLNNFSDALSSTLDSDFMPFFEDNIKFNSGVVTTEDNSRLRNTFHTNVKSLAKQFNIPIAVANGAAMDSILEGVNNELSMALDPDNATEFDATAAFKKVSNIYKMLSTTDEAGFNFKKAYKNKDGVLSNPYKAQLGNFRTVMGSLRSIADKQIKARVERDTNLVMNSAIVDAYKGKPWESISQKVIDLGLSGDIKPEALEARLNGLRSIISEAKGIVTDPRALAKFQLDIAAGKYSSYTQLDSAAREAMKLGIIHPNDIQSTISSFNSYESNARARESAARERKNSALTELNLKASIKSKSDKEKRDSGEIILKRMLLENKTLFPASVSDKLEANGLAILESGNYNPSDEASFRNALFTSIKTDELDLLIQVPPSIGPDMGAAKRSEAAKSWNNFRKVLTSRVTELEALPKTPENRQQILDLVGRIKGIHEIYTSKTSVEQE